MLMAMAMAMVLWSTSKKEEMDFAWVKLGKSFLIANSDQWVYKFSVAKSEGFDWNGISNVSQFKRVHLTHVNN